MAQKSIPQAVKRPKPAKRRARPVAVAKPDLAEILHQLGEAIAYVEVAVIALDSAVEDGRPPGAELVVLRHGVEQLLALE